jgi:hypothetical protein
MGNAPFLCVSLTQDDKSNIRHPPPERNKPRGRVLNPLCTFALSVPYYDSIFHVKFEHAHASLSP